MAMQNATCSCRSGRMTSRTFIMRFRRDAHVIPCMTRSSEEIAFLSAHHSVRSFRNLLPNTIKSTPRIVQPDIYHHCLLSTVQTNPSSGVMAPNGNVSHALPAQHAVDTLVDKLRRRSVTDWRGYTLKNTYFILFTFQTGSRLAWSRTWDSISTSTSCLQGTIFEHRSIGQAHPGCRSKVIRGTTQRFFFPSSMRLYYICILIRVHPGPQNTR